MRKVLVCDCGATIRGENDDELVANAQKHADEAHGGMRMPREQLLAMARPAPEER
ncbi:MAG TPA: DUF1059 domain-containing protein [Chloroflexota bacterium]|nr:DUF1059 domain-containing protein [Chloroflexota bacterium]